MFQALRGRWDALGVYKGAPVYRHECPVVWCRAWSRIDVSATCLLSLRSVPSAAIRHRYKNNLYYIAVQSDTYWYITHGFIERDSIAGKWGGE